jgi:hypothetical protein
MKAAKQKDWKTDPLPFKRTTIALNRRFSSTGMLKIREGLVLVNHMRDLRFDERTIN